MAVMTYTRRQVVDMLPEFLTTRLRTFDPQTDAVVPADLQERYAYRNALRIFGSHLAQ